MVQRDGCVQEFGPDQGACHDWVYPDGMINLTGGNWSTAKNVRAVVQEEKEGSR